MSKKMTIIFVLMLFGSSGLFAQDKLPNMDFGVEFRTDLQIYDKTKTTETNEENKNNKFVLSHTRLNFQGNFTKNTSYRFRYRLRGNAATTNFEGTTNNVDYAYMTHKVNDMFKIRAGRHFLNGQGGREGDYSGKDVYLYSLVGSNIDDYKTGVSFMFNHSKQFFALGVVNAGEQTNQKAFGYSISYYGDFMDGMLKPIVSYYMKKFEDRPGDGTASYNETNMAVGLRFTQKMFFAEVDYLGRTVEEYSGTAEVKQTSIVATARYLGGAFEPHVKFFSDKQENGGTEILKSTGYSVAFEYYPNYKMEGVNWRTHAVYTSKKLEPTVGTNTTEKIIFLGAAFAFSNG